MLAVNDHSFLLMTTSFGSYMPKEPALQRPASLATLDIEVPLRLKFGTYEQLPKAHRLQLGGGQPRPVIKLTTPCSR